MLYCVACLGFDLIFLCSHFRCDRQHHPWPKGLQPCHVRPPAQPAVSGSGDGPPGQPASASKPDSTNADENDEKAIPAPEEQQQTRKARGEGGPLQMPLSQLARMLPPRVRGPFFTWASACVCVGRISIMPCGQHTTVPPRASCLDTASLR